MENSWVGKWFFEWEEIDKMGGYNVHLVSSLPPDMRILDPNKETKEPTVNGFHSTFGGGFAWEVIKAYSDLPIYSFDFRHWGYLQGPFKGHATTGELIELFGKASFEVDGDGLVAKAKFAYEWGELLGPLIKGRSY